MPDTPPRYSAQRLPISRFWGVWDRLSARFLPCISEECDTEGEHFEWLNYDEAEAGAAALNRDPLGWEERRRREQEETVARVHLFFAVNGWYTGRKTDQELRAVIEAWREAGWRAEEGLEI